MSTNWGRVRMHPPLTDDFPAMRAAIRAAAKRCDSRVLSNAAKPQRLWQTRSRYAVAVSGESLWVQRAKSHTEHHNDQ